MYVWRRKEIGVQDLLSKTCFCYVYARHILMSHTHVCHMCVTYNVPDPLSLLSYCPAGMPTETQF